MTNTSSLYRLTDRILDGQLEQILRDHQTAGSSIDSVWRDLTRRSDDVIVSKQTVSNWIAKL